MNHPLAYALGSLLKYITLAFVAYWVLKGVWAIVKRGRR